MVCLPLGYPCLKAFSSSFGRNRVKGFRSALVLLALLGTATMPGIASEVNIAKGCPVSVSPNPNYGSTGNNLASLTDGAYIHGRMWMQKGAVGWMELPIVDITIDLKSVQPISGLSFSTGSGDDSVQWPGSLFVWVSDDSHDWRLVGDLISLSEKNGIPQSETYANHRFATNELRTKGRYVRVSALSGNAFVFCDEIEVFKGPESFLSLPASGKAVKDTDAYIKDKYFSSRIIHRLNHDADAVRQAVKSSEISPLEKKQLLARLGKVASLIPGTIRRNSSDYESVLPVDKNDAEIFAIYGSLLKAEGHPSLYVWKKDRYDFLKPAEAPAKSAQAAKVSISMMQNEYRSDAILVTNATDSPKTAKIAVTGVPGGKHPDWLAVYAMPWTDTAVGVPVSAALVPLNYRNGTYSLKIPAGMTSRLWLTVNSKKLAAGNHKGELKISTSDNTATVQMEVRVSSVKMNRPRLSFCTWDYCSKPGRCGVNENNFADCLATMRSHYVDCPAGQGNDLPTPSADSYDTNGNLVKPISFTDFDLWVKQWPDARHFLIYPNSPTELCGFPMGSEGFNVRVGSWMKALAEHMRSIGHDPSEINLMIRDEPDEASQKVIIAWAKAIHHSKSGIQVIQDCNIGGFGPNSLMAEALRAADTSIPMLGSYHMGGANVQSFYKTLLKSGHKMWFYQCEGPGRMLDPYRYYRLGSWHAFKYGATGIGLWAFGDKGAFDNSWNQYTWIANEYSPLFFRPTDVTEGISWEACREGIQDYEYLAMLRDAAMKTKNKALKLQAEQLLNGGVDGVVGKFKSFRLRWNANPESAKADALRLKVIHLLEKMQ